MVENQRDKQILFVCLAGVFIIIISSFFASFLTFKSKKRVNYLFFQSKKRILHSKACEMDRLYMARRYLFGFLVCFIKNDYN